MWLDWRQKILRFYSWHSATEETSNIDFKELRHISNPFDLDFFFIHYSNRWHGLYHCLTLTRLDTRQVSRGRLGRSGNAKTARNSTKFVTDLPTDTARCRVACPQLKNNKREKTKKERKKKGRKKDRRKQTNKQTKKVTDKQINKQTK